MTNPVFGPGRGRPRVGSAERSQINGLPRSYLYVPGDRPRFLESARSRGADAIIVDLEDAVSAGNKEEAAVHVRDWLANQQAGSDQVWIRPDPLRLLEHVRLAAASCVTGMVLPKATIAAADQLDHLLAEVEQSSNRVHPIGVIALIESAAGLESAVEIAGWKRVTRLGIGRADLAAELGLSIDRLTVAQLSALWLQVVVASASASIDAPIAPVETDIHESPKLETTTKEFRDLGFRARTAVHPSQLQTINDVFTPSAADVQRARQAVDTFERATQSGTGVVLDVDGRMIDEAVIRSARAVLRRARTER